MSDEQAKPTSAAQAVAQFIAHVSYQEQEREKAKASEVEDDWVPSEQDRIERDKLLRDVLFALNLSRGELLARLRIEPITWDRWRKLKTVPQRMHLEALQRFAQPELSDGAGGYAPMPLPLDMLTADPDYCTWERLLLVYTFFPWETAIFWYEHPWSDREAIAEVALLALRDGEERGCSIIYMVPADEQWGQEYIENLKTAFGEADAARILSRICVIKLSGSDLKVYKKGFSLFNYEAHGDPRLAVGYVWLKGDSRAQRTEEPPVYAAISASSPRFTHLRQEYGTIIKSALAIIAQRRNKIQDFWTPNLTREIVNDLTRLPVILQGKEVVNAEPHTYLSLGASNAANSGRTEIVSDPA